MSKLPNELIEKRSEAYWDARKQRKTAMAKGDRGFRERRRAVEKYRRIAHDFS